jgi:hypothetical protein
MGKSKEKPNKKRKDFIVGVCPECKVRENDSSKKRLYKCPYCGRYFCEKHIEPRIAILRSDIDNINNPVLRDILYEEWRKPNGHPDWIWSREYLKKLKLEEERKREEFFQLMDLLKGNELKKWELEEKKEKPKVATIKESVTIIPKKVEKKPRVSATIIIVMFLTLAIIAFLLFSNNKSTNELEGADLRNLNKLETNISILENQPSTALFPLNNYKILFSDESKICESINGIAYLFFLNGSFSNFIVNSGKLFLNDSFYGNISLIFSLKNSSCKILDVPDDFRAVFYWSNISLDKSSPVVHLVLNISDKDFHSPEYYLELTNYVRPDDVRWFLDSFKSLIPSFEYDALDYIKRRLESEVRYRFEFGNYWQFPNETLNLKYGDCEDFSTTLLSLFKAYNSSLKCFNIGLYRHLTTFCILYFESEYPTFAFFDQGETRIRENWFRANSDYEKCVRIKVLVESFYSSYGLTPVENKVEFAFDDKTVKVFSSIDDFCKWIIDIA